jgi:hypothetical protein
MDLLRSFLWKWMKIDDLKKRIESMSQANDLLVVEVTGLKTVVDSAIVLINGFLSQINGAATLEEVKSVVAEIEAQKVALANAVAQNTFPSVSQ